MQLVFPVNPQGAQAVNSVVAVQTEDEQVAYFAAGVPLFVHGVDDRAGARLAACQLQALGLAKPKEIVQAFGVGRTTLYRQQQKLKQEGIGGLLNEVTGPKGPHKLTGEKRAQAQRGLNEGQSIRKTAQAVGMTEGALRYALKEGTLNRRAVAVSKEAPASARVHPDSGPGSEAVAERSLIREEALPPTPLSPSARAERALESEAGVGVVRLEERLLSSQGLLDEAEPRFEAMEAVQGGGAFVALPALLEQGLLDVGQAVYGKLRNGFYGLQSVLLTLACMALLRIRNPQQLQYQPPAELGVLLGLDRVPEVKTLRRKLGELAVRKKAAELGHRLAARWMKAQEALLGFLYLDGHVRPYHGHQYTLPKTQVARRRLAMAATTDFWINDLNGDPFFVVTAPAHDSLGSMLKEKILPRLREWIGERVVTVVFDREGWSPRLFEHLIAQRFHVLTYRKGKSEGLFEQEAWPEENFEEVSAKIDGRTVKYKLAERKTELLAGFFMREIRRLCDDGHQTALVSDREDLPAIELAFRLFSRWRQENFFRYMRHQFALDALLNYDAELADAERLILNPQRKEASAKVRAAKNELKRLQQEYARVHLEAQSSQGRKRQNRESKAQTLAMQIGTLRELYRHLRQQVAELPTRVPLQAVQDPKTIVQLDPEAKLLTTIIKMVAYRAETALVGLLAPHYARDEEEGRAVVREILLTPADVLPDPATHTLHIRLHPLANPRSNRAMQALCVELNQAQTTYPGTSWRLHYQADWVSINSYAPCQEF